MSAPKKPATTSRNTGSAELAPRPAMALYAVYAMAGAAVFGAIASVALYFQDSYVYRSALSSLKKTNDKAKAKDKQSAAELVKKAHEQVSATHKSAVIGAIVVLLALGFIAYGIWRGRHWSRWATMIIWFLCSFTATSVGIGSLLGVASDIPAAYKVPSFIAAALLVAAVVFTNMPSAVSWFALSKPAPAAGRPRGGLFAPRPVAPRTTTGTAKSTTSLTKTSATDRAADGAAATAIAADRARSKKRASTQSVAKGADLARSRAKAASKSRRTEA